MQIPNAYVVKNYNEPSDIHVHPDGNDACNGSFYRPVKTLTRSFELVSATRLNVIMAAGAYAEAAAVAWPTRKGVQVIGAGAGLTSVSGPGTSVITVTPGVQSSTWTGLIANLEIDHSAGASQSGVTFSNAAMTKKLLFSFKNCNFNPDDPADKSINVATHTDTSNAIRIYVSGDGSQVEIGGVIYFKVGNLADRLHCEQLWLVGEGASNGAIETSTDAIELRIRLYKCIVPHAKGLAGGSGSQVVTCLDCFSWIDYDDLTPEVFAQLDTADLIGSHSEVIVD